MRRRGVDQLELVARAKSGDRGAVEELLAETEDLVRKMAYTKIQKHRSFELEDLVQIGLLGIVAAIKTFDPARGVRFSTYAVWKIRGEFSRALRLDAFINLPECAIRTEAGRGG